VLETRGKRSDLYLYRWEGGRVRRLYAGRGEEALAVHGAQQELRQLRQGHFIRGLLGFIARQDGAQQGQPAR
jgi:hypothetical protein